MSDQSPDAVFQAFLRLHADITRGVAFATDPEVCSGPDAITPLERKREIAALLIEFTAQFLVTTGNKGWANEYFYAVASALRQLNAGTVPPLLAPSPRKGRPPEPADLWCARARVVVALIALRKARLSPEDAMAEILRVRHGVKRLRGAYSSGTLADTVLQWRRRLREEHKRREKNDKVDPHFEAVEIFAEGLRRIAARAVRPDALRELAKDQLAKAAIFAESAENPAR
jgi:hypothetical protein